MRSSIRLLLAALLGIASAVLVSCGSSGAGLIPAENAGPLESDFQAVARAAQEGDRDCGPTEAALRTTERDFQALPVTVNAGLRSRLAEGITHLHKTALATCSQPLTQTDTTGESSTATGTATTPPTATAPAKTQTTPTSTAPTSTTTTGTATAPTGTTPPPSNSGGGTAPGVGGNGESPAGENPAAGGQAGGGNSGSGENPAGVGGGTGAGSSGGTGQ
jgi:hypothetical protein